MMNIRDIGNVGDILTFPEADGLGTLIPAGVRYDKGLPGKWRITGFTEDGVDLEPVRD